MVASYTFTFRDVTAGRRDAAGKMIVTTLGDVTVALELMGRAELAEWEWATDGLNVGIDEETHRLGMNGWKVCHPEAGVIGLVFQGAGTRVHVEWYDPQQNDFYSTGLAAKLRHGAAQIIDARQRAGFGVPVEAEPELVKVPEPVRPVWLADGTQVRYHGSIESLRGEIFHVHECECFDCDGYELRPIGSWGTVARHVRTGSVTALDVAT